MRAVLSFWIAQSAYHGRVRVEGIAVEYLSDDCLRGAAVSWRQAHPKRLREQVGRGRHPVSHRVTFDHHFPVFSSLLDNNQVHVDMFSPSKLLCLERCRFVQR